MIDRENKAIPDQPPQPPVGSRVQSPIEIADPLSGVSGVSEGPTSSGGTGGSTSSGRLGIGQKKRFRVLRRCGFRCRYCGCPSTEVRLGIDHVVPVVRGGTDDESNLVAACFDCNVGKGVLDAGIPPAVSFLSWLIAQAARHDWVGDLARDEINSPSLREPDSFRDLAGQIRAEAGLDLHENVLSAAFHAWREYRYRGGRPTLLMRRLQEPFNPLDIERAADDASARVLRVADVQLREWSAGPSVWSSLYAWLVSLGFTDDRDLHSRTYCGDTLMDRLRDAETKRLRGRKLPDRWAGGKRTRGSTLCGERLKRAVEWSSAGDGPLRSWRGRSLVGDALFVSGDEWPDFAVSRRSSEDGGQAGE